MVCGLVLVGELVGLGELVLVGLGELVLGELDAVSGGVVCFAGFLLCSPFLFLFFRLQSYLAK